MIKITQFSYVYVAVRDDFLFVQSIKDDQSRRSKALVFRINMSWFKPLMLAQSAVLNIRDVHRARIVVVMMVAERRRSVDQQLMLVAA